MEITRKVKNNLKRFLGLDGPAIRNANRGDSRESIRRNTLSFLSLVFFSVLPRKTLKLTKDFCPLPNPLKPWKSRENAEITKEIPCLKLTKEFKKTKKRKHRAPLFS